MRTGTAPTSLRPLAWVLCALVLSVPSASAEDEGETIVSVAPDGSCSWLSIMRHPEPLYVRYQTNPACFPPDVPLDDVTERLPHGLLPGTPGGAVGVSIP